MILLLTCSLTNAQLKQIAEGPKFTEPEEGFAKIIQMKSGATFFVSIFFKTGINIRIYDANHSEKAVTTIIPVSKISKFEDIESVFEINNQIILFISDLDDHAPVLHRFIIDGTSGKLLKEQIITKLSNARAFVSDEELRSFSVKKDPYSDNYAICFFDIMAKERDKRIEIVHYGNDHREISRTFCSPNNQEGKFFLFLDMVVLGKDKVCAFLFESRGIYGFTYKGKIVMGTIQKGSASVNYYDLDLPQDIYTNWAISRFNPGSKKTIFLGLIRKSKNSSEYSINLNQIDSATNKQETLQQTGLNEQLNNAFKERFNKKDDYSGLPQNLFINDDGSFTIVYEEMLLQSQSGQYGGRSDTKLGKLVIATYDKKGVLTSNYLVPKAHWAIFNRVAPLYHSRKEAMAQMLYRGNQYKSFCYLNGKNKNYILFNDTERNNEVSKDGFVEIQGVSDCDAFLYPLVNNEIFPKREYAFGVPPAGSKEHNLALVTVSAYDKKSNIYVTLKLDKETRTSKDIKLVWLQPQ